MNPVSDVGFGMVDHFMRVIAIQAYEGKTSDIVRQLALAGVAVIWIFRCPNGVLPSILVWAGAAIILGMLFDLLQYGISSAIWQKFYKQMGREGKTLDNDCSITNLLIKPSYYFFYGKIILLIISYRLIIIHAFRVLVP